MLPHCRPAPSATPLRQSSRRLRGRPGCMLPGSAPGSEAFASVFELADAWPLTEGRFAEDCGRILALSSAHARCSASATVIKRYGVPLILSNEQKQLAHLAHRGCECLPVLGRLDLSNRNTDLPARRVCPDTARWCQQQSSKQASKHKPPEAHLRLVLSAPRGRQAGQPACGRHLRHVPRHAGVVQRGARQQAADFCGRGGCRPHRGQQRVRLLPLECADRGGCLGPVCLACAGPLPPGWCQGNDVVLHNPVGSGF